MKKINFKESVLKKGVMQVYDFGKVKLHAYKTNDPLEDEVFILEKDKKGVIIEAPLFVDNIKELEDYVNSLNITVEGLLLSYHMASSATLLPYVKRYSTQQGDYFAHYGHGKEITENFKTVFGDKVDASVNTVTNYIDTKSTSIAGIKMIIKETNDAFDIRIPEINSIYMHMLGLDCHSIVFGPAGADALIAQLKNCLRKGYDFILSSHHTPENAQDANIKINYLQDIKKFAARAKSAEKFKTIVKQKYPDYKSANYLDMTADFFFPK
ncbi:hypothetical protein [Endomicrobium proavitum]|uniref:Metallo-beta-lactamase domain-containing protein n=1 Tax=Endomicrobium proavitum TaxID=1408281 RepID=A0A0G3WLJ3_9BACT|nr:hypothetical protein [Endomicrobium proavitum]AKL98374.1 hypothetical protein Epro_0995 [Endomicrobium proavitum]